MVKNRTLRANFAPNGRALVFVGEHADLAERQLGTSQGTRQGVAFTVSLDKLPELARTCDRDCLRLLIG